MAKDTEAIVWASSTPPSRRLEEKSLSIAPVFIQGLLTDSTLKILTKILNGHLVPGVVHVKPGLSGPHFVSGPMLCGSSQQQTTRVLQRLVLTREKGNIAHSSQE